ncbi:AGAP012518-PA-like protein [Anopheles sinensis]|uniref:AGAP012518-PA-like protein n=1 Tax=Anopheles sinensis TaxID=74873 RepID=A0A084W5N5_ANOSI|nr:AGAP012518-PA-like protein [Anopheles sinensis]
MELAPEGKNFVIVKEHELPALMKELEKYFPHSLKPDNRTNESVGIFCPPDRLERMELIKDEDILFDWHSPIYMNFTHVGIMYKMEEIFREKVKGKLDGHIYGDIYVHECPAELDLALEPLAADEVIMKPLCIDDVKDIHDLYPARDIECLELFEKLVRQLPGFGVFTNLDNELAAWSLQSYYGGMFSMQTKPKFRRKGYGIQVAQSLTKLVIQRGYIPFVVIRPENDASRGLYMKLGFRKAFESVRGTFLPFVGEDPLPVKSAMGVENGTSTEVEIPLEKQNALTRADTNGTLSEKEPVEC